MQAVWTLSHINEQISLITECTHECKEDNYN